MGLLTRAINAIRGGTKAPDLSSFGIVAPDGTRELTQPTNAAQLLKMYREWVYSAANLNAMGVSSVPLRLYVVRRDTRKMLYNTMPVGGAQRKHMKAQEGLQRWMVDDAEVELVLDHPFYGLWDDGNAHLTGSQLKRVIVTQMDLTGDSFNLMPGAGDGMPLGLIPLAPHTMYIEVDTETHEITAYIQKVGTVERRYAPHEIVHFKHPDPTNMYYGYAPLEAVSLAATLYHDFNLYEHALMENGAVPGLMVTATEGITEPQRKIVERKINQRVGGKSNAGKTLVHGGALKIDRIGLTQKEMSFEQGRVLSRKEILAAFSVPEELVIPDNSNRATSANAEDRHARYAILPRLTLMQDQVNKDVLPLFDGDSTIFAAFDNPIPSDNEFNLKRAVVMVGTSDIFRIDEARKAAGEDPLEVGGDEFITQASAPDPFAPAPEPEEPVERAVNAVRAKQTIVPGNPGIRMEKGLSAALRAYFAEQETWTQEKGEVDDALWHDTWDAELTEIVSPFLIDGLTRGATEGLRRIGLIGKGVKGTKAEDISIAFDLESPEVIEFVEDYTFRFAQSVNAGTQETLREVFTLAASEGHNMATVADSVEAAFGSMARYRSVMIARTETARSQMAGQTEAWANSGVVEAIYWDAEVDACPYCMALEARFGVNSGSPIKLGANFVDQGAGIDAVDADGKTTTLSTDYSAIPYPPAHPHCRCDTRAVISED